MDTVVIRCKDCGALFYANACLEPADVLDIVEYARRGDKVDVVDAAVVRVELGTCTCGIAQRDR
jgi:hypothetical protein